MKLIKFAKYNEHVKKAIQEGYIWGVKYEFFKDDEPLTFRFPKWESRISPADLLQFERKLRSHILKHYYMTCFRIYGQGVEQDCRMWNKYAEDNGVALLYRVTDLRQAMKPGMHIARPVHYGEAPSSDAFLDWQLRSLWNAHGSEYSYRNAVVENKEITHEVSAPIVDVLTTKPIHHSEDREYRLITMPGGPESSYIRALLIRPIKIFIHQSCESVEEITSLAGELGIPTEIIKVCPLH